MKPVTEDELKANAKAIRITEEDLDANIIAVNYLNVGQALTAVAKLHPKEAGPTHERHRLLTICVMVLANGFVLTGESACADPANFDPMIGRRLAYNQARDKIWDLMGYELRSKLMAEQQGWLDGDARRNGAA